MHLKGRLQILDHMDREISVPQTQDDRNSPRLATLKYRNDTLRHLIGPLGALKRKIEEETGARISISDGTLIILAKNQSVMEKVQEKIDFIIGREIEVGGIYKGIVASIKGYGAFVEFNGGQQGLLHISKLSHDPVYWVSDVVSVGQQLSLVSIGTDVRGNIKLSLKANSLRLESDKRCSTSQTDTHDKLSDEETKVESLMTTKNLKLGTKVNAKVYKIRAHGLVLDLGGGIHGMYRFEGNGNDNFEVGNELLVECSSFTGKGILVMSMVDEE